MGLHFLIRKKILGHFLLFFISLYTEPYCKIVDLLRGVSDCGETTNSKNHIIETERVAYLRWGGIMRIPPGGSDTYSRNQPHLVSKHLMIKLGVVSQSTGGRYTVGILVDILDRISQKYSHERIRSLASDASR